MNYASYIFSPALDKTVHFSRSIKVFQLADLANISHIIQADAWLQGYCWVYKASAW